MTQGRYYEYGCQGSFGFNIMPKIFIYTWKKSNWKHSISFQYDPENKQWNDIAEVLEF